MITNHTVEGGKLISSSWTNNPEDCAFHCFEIERCNGFRFDEQDQIHSCVLFSGSSAKPSPSSTAVVGICSKGKDGKSTERISTQTISDGQLTVGVSTQTTPHEEVIAASSTVAAPTSTSSTWEKATKSTLPGSTENHMQATEDEEIITVDLKRSGGASKPILIVLALSVLAMLACCYLARRRIRRADAHPSGRDQIPRIESEPSHYFTTISDPNGALGRV